MWGVPRTIGMLVLLFICIDRSNRPCAFVHCCLGMRTVLLSAEMDGREFDGARIVVQPGRGHRPNGPKFATRRTEHRITVEGLDSHTSWQDLKVCSWLRAWVVVVVLCV